MSKIALKLVEEMQLSWDYGQGFHTYSTLRYVALYKEPETMRYILISQKKTFLYVYIYIIYGVVLIPNYKRTYDQSDQIEK